MNEKKETKNDEIKQKLQLVNELTSAYPALGSQIDDINLTINDINLYIKELEKELKRIQPEEKNADDSESDEDEDDAAEVTNALSKLSFQEQLDLHTQI